MGNWEGWVWGQQIVLRWCWPVLNVQRFLIWLCWAVSWFMSQLRYSLTYVFASRIFIQLNHSNICSVWFICFSSHPSTNPSFWDKPLQRGDLSTWLLFSLLCSCVALSFPPPQCPLPSMRSGISLSCVGVFISPAWVDLQNCCSGRSCITAAHLPSVADQLLRASEKSKTGTGRRWKNWRWQR